MALLEARDVTRTFSVRGAGRARRTLTAVDGVSLAVEPGMTLGVVGESGSGKSTLGEVLGGLQPASSGEVLYHGDSTCARSTDGRVARIAATSSSCSKTRWLR